MTGSVMLVLLLILLIDQASSRIVNTHMTSALPKGIVVLDEFGMARRGKFEFDFSVVLTGDTGRTPLTKAQLEQYNMYITVLVVTKRQRDWYYNSLSTQESTLVDTVNTCGSPSVARRMIQGTGNHTGA